MNSMCSFFFFRFKKYLLSTCLVAKSCPTLSWPYEWRPPGSSVHGISQTRILEWVVISFSRGSSQPKDQTQVSRTAGRLFTVWATRDFLTLYACVILTTPVSSDSRAGLGISYDTDGVAGGLYFLYSSLWSIENHFLVLYKIGWVSFFFLMSNTICWKTSFTHWLVLHRLDLPHLASFATWSFVPFIH